MKTRRRHERVSSPSPSLSLALFSLSLSLLGHFKCLYESRLLTRSSEPARSFFSAWFSRICGISQVAKRLSVEDWWSYDRPVAEEAGFVDRTTTEICVSVCFGNFSGVRNHSGDNCKLRLSLFPLWILLETFHQRIVLFARFQLQTSEKSILFPPLTNLNVHNYPLEG